MSKAIRPGCTALAIALAISAGATTSFAQPERTAGPQTGIADLAEVDAKQPTFDDPRAAVDALRSLLAADKFDAVAKLLGLDSTKLKAADGTMESYAEIRDAAAERIGLKDQGGRKLLELGNKLWPFPFPLAKDDTGKWFFDTQAGLEEVINRRVGENELETIATMRAYVDAQRLYAAMDRDGDGVLEYAQKLISSEGETDGLYWPTEQGDGESPAGGMATDEALDKARRGQGYFGYRYRVLTRQGGNVAGGAYDYVINGNMIAGFALIAWPVKYAETGVHTFAVNHAGIVYETDLGPNTEKIVGYVESFNPDDSWKVVTE